MTESVIKEVVLSGGPTFYTVTDFPSEMEAPVETVSSASDTTISYTPTEFLNDTYFNAIALIMSLGDSNAIMLAETDEWRNLESLFIDDVLFNLEKRADENKPPMVGKYMLSYVLIKQHIKKLSIPGSYFFTPLVQDQIMSSVTNTYINRLQYHNIVATYENLFGCHYLASADAWAAILKNTANDNVSDILHNIGYYTNSNNSFNEYNRDTFISKIYEIFKLALNEVQWRTANNQNVIASGITGSEVTIWKSVNEYGYNIGNGNFEDKAGGYFLGITLDQLPSNIARIGPPLTKGSAGTVSVKLEDAGACAVAGVLETSNKFDQAGIAQVILNRTGATVATSVIFASTAFDCAAQPAQFSAIDAALYGPNSNESATIKYGNLYIDQSTLKSALSVIDKDNFKIAVQSIFRNTLTDDQLSRIYILRQHVYYNGPEINQAQVAVKGAVNIVSNTSVASSTIIKPQGPYGSGYVITSVVPGYYIPNTSYIMASSPSPTLSALYNRITTNIEQPLVELTFNYTQILHDQSNALITTDLVTIVQTTEDLDIRRVSNQPTQPDIGNFAGGIPEIDPDYPSYNINNMRVGNGQEGYNADK